MREATVVAQVKKALSAKGLYHVTFHGSYLTANGTPDILACGPGGQFIGIECKTPSGAIAVVQWRRALEILASGGRVIIANADIKLDDPSTIDVTGLDEYQLHDAYHALDHTVELKLGSGAHA